ncbi:hypothetical protein B0H63DRAFT_519952 [Podospora didyma]|uniref:Uncharacterized protein n=1 Tax=Podospora didyma TaxID=330526 RepID=A0AAE0NZP0_9PEZI|nr:hypothetical protein B0H63DRAFT_519952 [Podospora didyma]
MTSPSKDISGVITTSVGPGYAVKWQVVVYYQSKDLSLFPAGHFPAETGSINNPSGLPEAQASPDTASGLSTAAKAGIGAGVSGAVITLLIALFFLFRRRWRPTGSQTVQAETEYLCKPELDATSAAKSLADNLDPSSHELDGFQLEPKQSFLPEGHGAELEAVSHLPSELAGPGAVSPGNLDPSELPTPYRVAGHWGQPQPQQNASVTAPTEWQYWQGQPQPHVVESLRPLALTEFGMEAGGHSAIQAGATGSSMSQPTPTMIEELELQDIETEERRIQQRKEELLRARANNDDEAFWYGEEEAESTGNIESYLQAAAKLHKLLVVASLAAPSRSSDLEYMLTRSFWGGLRGGESKDTWAGTFLSLFLLLSTLIITLVGPAFAILIVPELDWFSLPGALGGFSEMWNWTKGLENWSLSDDPDFQEPGGALRWQIHTTRCLRSHFHIGPAWNSKAKPKLSGMSLDGGKTSLWKREVGSWADDEGRAQLCMIQKTEDDLGLEKLERGKKYF